MSMSTQHNGAPLEPAMLYRRSDPAEIGFLTTAAALAAHERL